MSRTIIIDDKFWKFINMVTKDREIHVTDGYIKTTFTEELMDVLQEWDRYNTEEASKNDGKNGYNLIRFSYMIINEYHRARIKFPKMASPHEGYAIIKEELEELWELVKSNEGKSSKSADEVKQIGAMCLAYYLEVVLGELYDSSEESVKK